MYVMATNVNCGPSVQYVAQEKKHKFLVRELGRMYIVSRLHKETYKVAPIGANIHHSELPQLSVGVPKNGLSSSATISFQVRVTLSLTRPEI